MHGEQTYAFNSIPNKILKIKSRRMSSKMYVTFIGKGRHIASSGGKGLVQSSYEFGNESSSSIQCWTILGGFRRTNHCSISDPREEPLTEDYAKLQVLTAVSMKITVFLLVKLCSLIEAYEDSGKVLSQF
jgi:hypothetical protein